LNFIRELLIPFYGFNRLGAKVIKVVIDNWWRQGMMGATNAHYECIKVFLKIDQTEDLKANLLNQVKLRSITHRWRPSFWLVSMPRRAMRV
jgi:hypothetical protein